MAIKIKASHKGRLHRALGVKGKIPVSRLEAAKRSGSAKVRREANFALNARSWKKN